MLSLQTTAKRHGSTLLRRRAESPTAFTKQSAQWAPLRRVAVLALALLAIFDIAGCQGSRRPHRVDPSEQAPAVIVDPALALPTDSETPVVMVEPCAEKIARVLDEPGLPGAPTLEAQRTAILTESKAEPVWFVATPQYTDDEELGPPAIRYRKQISETQFPVDVLARLIPAFALAPKVGRQVLLRNGYLFADNPNLARALVTGLTVEHLFAHDAIWIRRGEMLMHAERRRGVYYYTDGPNSGERVTLLLFDELGHGPVPERSLVRDFRALQARVHFDRATVKHATEGALVAELSYGPIAVTTLLRSQGPHLEFDCELPPNDPTFAAQKAERAKRFRFVQHLRASMLNEVAEKLPFDEPKREWGLQLDGKLRQNWRHAYLMQRASFAFNGDRYFVFDAQGRPIVPQVCVDFLTDTLERTSGTWWRAKDKPPGRDVGGLDFDAVAGSRRDELRRVPMFVDYAREQTTQFEVLDVAEADRIQLGDQARFIDYLATHAADYQPGDIVVIRGPTPWDRRQQHYHSFFIYESDPITGIPIAVLGNAGRPTVRHWRVETQRTPRRTIWHRIRLKTEWLEAIVDPEGPSAPVPPPLSPRGNPG